LDVFDGAHARITGVVPRLAENRRVVAWNPENAAAGESSGVGLHLQVSSVHEPVADVGDEHEEDEEDGQPEDDHHEHGSSLVRRSPEPVREPDHEHPAE
jgi:hypothetical protein